MDKLYSTYRYEFSEQSTWREALGFSTPLLICNDREFGCMDAKEYIPAGSSEWRCLISKGTGNHIYGAATTWGKR